MGYIILLLIVIMVLGAIWTLLCKFLKYIFSFFDSEFKFLDSKVEFKGISPLIKIFLFTLFIFLLCLMFGNGIAIAQTILKICELIMLGIVVYYVAYFIFIKL